MRIILISPPANVEHETSLVNRMFEEGLTIFHLRKPGYNRKRLSVYLNKIKREFHHQIIVHSCYGLLSDYDLRGIHIRAADKDSKESFIERYKDRNDLSISISCHALNELTDNMGSIDYAFLSPVFDSISKSSYKAGFDYEELADMLERIELDTIALGGCRAEYLGKIKKLGFAGAAFLGAVWSSPDPVGSYLSINNYHLSMINEK